MGDHEGADGMHKRLIVPGGDDGDYGDIDEALYEAPTVSFSRNDSPAGREGNEALEAPGDALEDVNDELAKHGVGMAPAWQRKAVTGFIGVGVFCQYAMRSNLSVAMVDMPDRYGWSNGWTGPVLSAFFGVRDG